MLAPDIVTDRLILTALSRADSPALFAYRSLPEVCRYQNWEPSRLEDAVTFIGSLESIEFNTPGTWFQFGIRLRESGDLIGDLGAHFFEDGQQVEVGFSVTPAAQHRGFGTEAVAGLFDCLFGALHKHRIIAAVDPRNQPSVRLLRRVGMRQEAHFIQSLFFKGEWADELVFAVLVSEWKVGSQPGATRRCERDDASVR